MSAKQNPDDGLCLVARIPNNAAGRKALAVLRAGFNTSTYKLRAHNSGPRHGNRYSTTKENATVFRLYIDGLAARKQRDAIRYENWQLGERIAKQNIVIDEAVALAKQHHGEIIEACETILALRETIRQRDESLELHKGTIAEVPAWIRAMCYFISRH